MFGLQEEQEAGNYNLWLIDLLVHCGYYCYLLHQKYLLFELE